jgi:hypothetical protein
MSVRDRVARDKSGTPSAFPISLDEPLEVDVHAKIAIIIDFIHGDNLSLF